MELPSNEAIEKSIERAEKCLKKNDLKGAESHSDWAYAWIEKRRFNSDQDNDSDVSKLNEFSKRLIDIKGIIAGMRWNPESPKNPESEINYEYLFQKLSSIEKTLYDENKDLVNEYIACGRRFSGTQTGKRGIAGKVKDRLLGSSATKKRDKLKKEVSKTGYLCIREINHLIDVAQTGDKMTDYDLLSSKIHQEIEKLPKTLKPVVESCFNAAKGSSTEHLEVLTPVEDDSDSGSGELPVILEDSGSQSPIEWIPIESDHNISNFNNPKSLIPSEDPAQKMGDKNTTLAFAEKGARKRILANIYASEVLSAKGEHESAKNMLEEAEKLYKSLTNTEGFTEEMNKTRVLALLYASEVLNSNGYYDLADKKREKAKQISKQVTQDSEFNMNLIKTRILALLYASEVLNSNGYYDLADKKREKAKHLSKSNGVVMDDAFINDLRKSRSGDYYG